jgi:hypothetical protein
MYMAVAALYFFLSPAVEVANPLGLRTTRTKIASESKRIVTKLTAPGASGIGVMVQRTSRPNLKT